MAEKRFDEADVERLAKFIAQKESRDCKTLDSAIHHQSTWPRIVPEARQMLEAALVAEKAPKQLTEGVPGGIGHSCDTLEKL